MMEQKTITRLDIYNVETVLSDTSLLLVACIRNFHDCENLEKLKSLSAFFSTDLKVFYVLEDLFRFFERYFLVYGTPTLLLIKEGVILDALLGRHSVQEITTWIRSFERYQGVSGIYKKSRPAARKVKVLIPKHSNRAMAAFKEKVN